MKDKEKKCIHKWKKLNQIMNSVGGVDDYRIYDVFCEKCLKTRYIKVVG